MYVTFLQCNDSTDKSPPITYQAVTQRQGESREVLLVQEVTGVVTLLAR